MKNYWGGFMKKRISCKVIRSIPLTSEDINSSYGDITRMRRLSTYFNFDHAKSRPVIYTQNMQIEKENTDDNITKPSIDFYA